ncbi:hypothetical protein NDU88_003538 [Pleurodeles waltl]|uniref:Uncharacterized protein n=1 Tax=Pleurodeles waltl TaxID=8319 RepID=A0AAV7V0V6_PLEWA|nr:hypothetical protein NDU88_003538 [Pleurodeles waltl]
MWDKVAPGRTEGTGGVTHRASGVESLDWRSHDAGRQVDGWTGGSVVDSHHRVEIQQDGTMAVVSTDLAGGTVVEQGLEDGGDGGDSLTMIFMIQGASVPPFFLFFCRVENVLILFSRTHREANSLFFDRIQTLRVLRGLGRLGLLFSSLSHSGMDFPRLSPPHVYAGRWSAPGSLREFGGKSPPGAPKVRRERE